MKIRLATEKPFVLSPSVALVGIAVGLSMGGVVAVADGLCTGFLVAFFIAPSLVFWVSEVVGWIKTRPLPADARVCAEAALRRFQYEYPNARIVSVALRDTSEERFIISIRHEGPVTFSMPTARMYYAVKRSDHTVTSEERRKWWPKGLK